MGRPNTFVGERREKAEQMLKDGVSRKQICEDCHCDYEQLRKAFGAKYTRKHESRVEEPSQAS